ncbi:N-acetylgalactosamine-6-sulfatase [Planctomycetales bacterium 10988]|nr:N-acetylgalactosamine-6-sulfatase [Planctomycetales bacterium 10988]
MPTPLFSPSRAIAHPSDAGFSLAVLGFFLVSALCLSLDSQLEAKQPPNIIYIMADDLGYGDLGCYGQETIQTPHIDQLAAEGMKFTDFYAGSTVCAPSRCVLMTGLHTGHCFIRGNGKDNLRPSDITVAEVLKDAGYTTALCGKWGLGHEGSEGVPTKQGFDFFFGYLDQHHAHNYYPTFLMKNEERVLLPNIVPGGGEWGQGVASEKKAYSHELVMEEALQFVEAAGKKPFFLYLALTIPHANNEARQEGMEIPDYGQYTDRDWPEPQKGHAAMISLMDSDIGRLMDLLKSQGVDENTVVMFTSDNGPHKEGGNDPYYHDSNGELRGIKRDLYEGGIRVPMIVRWPGKVEAGSTTNYVGSFIDFMPTAAELAGVSAPEGLDGLSFVPTLLGKKQPKHDYLYWAFYERGFKEAVRKGKWKAVRIGGPEGTLELYNLQKDIGEENNIADQHPKIVEEMVSMMKEAYTPSERWKPKIGAQQNRNRQ